METQKVIKFLEDSDDDEFRFQTKKWINYQNNGQYGKRD